MTDTPTRIDATGLEDVLLRAKRAQQLRAVEDEIEPQQERPRRPALPEADPAKLAEERQRQVYQTALHRGVPDSEDVMSVVVQETPRDELPIRAIRKAVEWQRAHSGISVKAFFLAMPGTTGTGKTCGAAWHVARYRAIKKGHGDTPDALMVDVGDFFETRTWEAEAAWRNRIREVPLLVIDEGGREADRRGRSLGDVFPSLFVWRQQRGKSTVVIANIAAQRPDGQSSPMLEYLGFAKDAAIISRLDAQKTAGLPYLVPCGGADLRKVTP